MNGFSGPDEEPEKREVRRGKRMMRKRGRRLMSICLTPTGVSAPAVSSVRGRRRGRPPPNW